MTYIQTDRPQTAVGTRILTPENCRIFTGVFSLLHAHVEPDEEGTGLYRAIHAVRTFPVSSPEQYISLRYPDEHGTERELGVIVDLAAFSEEAQILIRESLAQHYFEYQIVRIYRIEWKYNLLFFDVETTQGRAEFQMRWQVDRALDYGTHSKVLLDVFDNRYVIPDPQSLPRADREKLVRYIYW